MTSASLLCLAEAHRTYLRSTQIGLLQAFYLKKDLFLVVNVKKFFNFQGIDTLEVSFAVELNDIMSTFKEIHYKIRSKQLNMHFQMRPVCHQEPVSIVIKRSLSPFFCFPAAPPLKFTGVCLLQGCKCSIGTL